MSDTMSETNRMTETETEGQEGYIPHAKQVDFSRFDEEMLKKAYGSEYTLTLDELPNLKKYRLD